MYIRLRVSYNDDKGLKKILDKLGTGVISWKEYKKQSGLFKKAEIIVRE